MQLQNEVEVAVVELRRASERCGKRDGVEGDPCAGHGRRETQRVFAAGEPGEDGVPGDGIPERHGIENLEGFVQLLFLAVQVHEGVADHGVACQTGGHHDGVDLLSRRRRISSNAGLDPGRHFAGFEAIKWTPFFRWKEGGPGEMAAAGNSAGREEVRAKTLPCFSSVPSDCNETARQRREQHVFSELRRRTATSAEHFVRSNRERSDAGLIN